MPTSSTDALSPGKRLAFYTVLLSPLLLTVGVCVYLVLGTSLLQEVYLSSLRNLELPCLQWTNQGFVYKGRPGACELNNLEYRTTLTFDQEGFRNIDTKTEVDVVLIGDSHTQGFGVDDSQPFAEILRTRFRFRTKNLGTSSYATLREFEALKAYSNREKVVVVQYCNNDAAENLQSLRLSRDEFLQQVRDRWSLASAKYRARKARGLMAPLSDFSRAVLQGKFKSKAEFHALHMRRNMASEADAFAQNAAKYRSLLEGKKLIVFESSGHGFNHPEFKAQFEASLSRYLPGVDATVLDSHALLRRSDYYRIDDHLNPQGHAHVAALLQAEIAKVVMPVGH